MVAVVLEQHDLLALMDHGHELNFSCLAVGHGQFAFVHAGEGFGEHEVLFDLVDGDHEFLLRHIGFARTNAGDGRWQIGGQQAGGEAGGNQQCGLEGAQVHDGSPVFGMR